MIWTHTQMSTRSSAIWSWSPIMSDSPTPSKIFQTSCWKVFEHLMWKNCKYELRLANTMNANLNRSPKFCDVYGLWVVTVEYTESPTASDMEVLKKKLGQRSLELTHNVWYQPQDQGHNIASLLCLNIQGIFNCSSQFSVLKWKMRGSQSEILFHEILDVQRSSLVEQRFSF